MSWSSVLPVVGGHARALAGSLYSSDRSRRVLFSVSFRNSFLVPCFKVAVIRLTFSPPFSFLTRSETWNI